MLQTQNTLKDLLETIALLKEKSKHKILAGQEQEILGLLANYAKTLTLFEQYDKEKLSLVRKAKRDFILKEDNAQKVIENIKKELIVKKEASDLFVIDNNNRLKGIINSIYQTFEKKELYPSLEEKAAHLLYLIIKDHPFVDGNKRIASFFLCLFLG